MSGGGFYASKAREEAGGGQAAGEALPKALLRKLKALGYPDLESASLGHQDYCKIVLWLEEEKIRLYEQKDRKVLRDFSTKAWYQHAADYARELGVSAAGLAEDDLPKKLQVLNSLVNFAVHDIYRDKVEIGEVKLVADTEHVTGGVEKQLLGDLQPPLNRILKHLQLPKLPEDAIDTDTVAALRCLQTRLVEPSKATETLDLDSLPTGIDLEDKEVKRVAGVLRLLHGIELGQLQVNINYVVNDLQQVTADPKTDSSLGKVGT